MSQSGFYTNEMLEAPTGTAETSVNEGSDEFVPYTEEEWAARKKKLDAWYWEYARMGKKNGKEFIKCTFHGCANENMFSFAQKSASSFTRHLAKHDLTDPVAAERAGVINAQAQDNKRARRTPSKGKEGGVDKPGKKARKTAPGALPHTLPKGPPVNLTPSAWATPPVPAASPVLAASGLAPRPISSPINSPLVQRYHIRIQCEGLLETANVSFSSNDTFPEIVRRAASSLARATDGPLASILLDSNNMRDVLRDRGGYIVGDLCDLVPDELYRLVLL